MIQLPSRVATPGRHYVPSAGDQMGPIPQASTSAWSQSMTQFNAQVTNEPTGIQHGLHPSQTEIETRNINESLSQMSRQGGSGIFPHYGEQGVQTGFHSPSEGRSDASFGSDPQSRFVAHTGTSGLNPTERITPEVERQVASNRVGGQNPVLSEHSHSRSASTTSHQMLSELVSADDLSSLRNSTPRVGEGSVIASGSNLDSGNAVTNVQDEIMRTIGEPFSRISVTSPSQNQSTLGDYDAENFQWQRWCHKVMLAKNSPMLRYVFDSSANHLEVNNSRHETIETGNCRASFIEDTGRKVLRVELLDVKISSMESILGFIYKGELQFDLEDFATLVDDAKKLQFQVVLDICTKFLSQPVDVSNCISLLRLGHAIGSEHTLNKCLDFIVNNAADIIQQKQPEVIGSLPPDCMEKLMNSDQIVESNAENAFKALIIWAQQHQHRPNYLLLNTLRPKIKLLSLHFLLNLANQVFIQSSQESLRLINATMQTKLQESSWFSDSTHGEAPASRPQTSGCFSQNNPDLGLCSTSSTSISSSIGGSLLVLTSVWKEGGKGNGIHEKLDFDRNCWNRWATKDLGDMFEVVFVDELMAVIGGIKYQKCHANVEMFDFSTQKWNRGPKMIKARANFGCCLVNRSFVIVCGGKTTNNKVIPDCEILNLNANGSLKWELLPPMPIKRFASSVCSVGNRVFVIGGAFGVEHTITEVYDVVEEFDVSTFKWRTKSSMNEARCNFAIAAYQNMIYVFGGWRDMQNLDSAERYDPSTDTWVYLSSMPSPRDACTAGFLADKIYVIGGYNEGWVPDTDIYDVEKDEYQRGPDLEFEANRPKCVAVAKQFLFQS